MQPSVQSQTVKSAIVRSSTQFQRTNAATTPARPATAPKTRTRFLDFLMTALAGPTV
jgi:hypothetical protein